MEDPEEMNHPVEKQPGLCCDNKIYTLIYNVINILLIESSTLTLEQVPETCEQVGKLMECHIPVTPLDQVQFCFYFQLVCSADAHMGQKYNLFTGAGGRV